MDYSYLRVFGCLAFASNLPSSRTKFDPRATSCVFLGYPPGVKGYRLYDIQRKHFFISRDVVFHENVFPFNSESNQPENIDSFPDLVLPIGQTDLSIIEPIIPLSTRNQIDVHNSLVDSAPSILSLNRSSTRSVHPPTYLRDYHCNLLENQQTRQHSSFIRYPLCDYISYNALCPSFKTFSLNVSSHIEPKFYYQDVKHPEWRDAMHTKLQAM